MAEAKNVQKIKRKKWYPIHAENSSGKAVLGETYTADPQDLVGKGVSVNLSTLTGDLKQQNVTLKFTIAKIDDKGAHAELIGYTLAPASVRRLISRNVNRIDDVLTCKTSDGFLLSLKPLVLTRSRTHTSVLQALRKAALQSIAAEVPKSTFEQFTQQVLDHRFQSALKKSLSKIYPTRAVEIKSFSVSQQTENKSDEKQ